MHLSSSPDGSSTSSGSCVPSSDDGSVPLLDQPFDGVPTLLDHRRLVGDGGVGSGKDEKVGKRGRGWGREGSELRWSGRTRRNEERRGESGGEGDEPSSHVINGSSSEGRVVVSHPKEVSDEDGSTEERRKRKRSDDELEQERESGRRTWDQQD